MCLAGMGPSGKPAKAMGMATSKDDEAEAALREHEGHLELSLIEE